MSAPRAHQLGLIGCHVCGLVAREPRVAHAACPRCGASLHRRKTASVSTTWAFLLAALFMYVPANVLPIMRTVSLGEVDDNTIISGVVELWVKGSPSLAVIVFTASILVPLMKFVVLTTLLVSTQRGSAWALRQRALLYRMVEFVGYWSMLDVFVVALLTALVRFGFFSQVEPLPGVVFFGVTVVLTMLASMAFDPRLMWDDRDDD